MEQGYIKLWRRTTISRVFQNADLLKVWVWCLMRAAHKEHWVILKTGKGNIEIKILPGQFIFGRESAAKELSMPPSSVWDRMVKLKKLQNLDIKSDRQYSLISIINWPTYQDENNKSDRQPTGNRQATDRQYSLISTINWPTYQDENNGSDRNPTGTRQATDTNENVKKEKKEKKSNKRKNYIPDDYKLEKKHIDYANSKGITEGIEDLFEGFCIYHRKKGTQYVDWYATWQTWIRYKIKWEKEDEKKQAEQTPKEYKPTIEELIS